MRTYMIGAGAMGWVYGGLLAHAGFDVTLIDPREDHIGRVQRDGVIVEGVRGHHVVRVPAVDRVTRRCRRRLRHHLHRRECHEGCRAHRRSSC